jgi:hypothetical protein
MGEGPTNSSKRVLEPLERFSEVLFGLIMVLTFTCSLNVAEAGRGDVRTMLLGALGCNLAWGIIDAVMYLMACLSEKGHNIALLRALRLTSDPDEGRRIIASAVPQLLVSVLPLGEFEVMRQKLNQLPDLPPRPSFTRDDWRGALGVFLLVFVSTFPPVIPFLFITRVRLAVRISNAIALVLLVLTGYAYGNYAGHRPWGWALSMVLIGGAMVGLAIALGG